jgi:3-oxoacyl-[acyl-carrier protein] reductase
MRRLEGKVAIVTGGSKGIGAAIARTFAREGASVVVVYAQSDAQAAGVVRDIVDAGGAAIAVKADVTHPDQVEHLLQETRTAFGRLDVVVNNAGVYGFAPLEDIQVEDFDSMFRVNVLGPLLLIREAAKAFGADGGSVINIVSASATTFEPASAVYTASKCALVAITRVLAKELGARNIRVNGISPGPTETEGLHALGVMGTQAETHMVSMTPLGRMGKPEDIAKVALFLASEEAAWITGDVILAAGGPRLSAPRQ